MNVCTNVLIATPPRTQGWSDVAQNHVYGITRQWCQLYHDMQHRRIPVSRTRKCTCTGMVPSVPFAYYSH
eukprot:SAG11_NODE_16286_length_552_cov_0.909492_1_plen_69_part_01